jgi:hypothetical protein
MDLGILQHLDSGISADAITPPPHITGRIPAAHQEKALGHFEKSGIFSLRKGLIARNEIIFFYSICLAAHDLVNTKIKLNDSETTI